MKRISALLVVFVLLTFSAAAQEKMVVQSFKFKFKAAEKAAVVVKPLVSSEGSVSIQPGSNTLVVTDFPDNVRQIANALGKYDTQPQSFKVQIRLVSVARVNNPGPIPADLEPLSQKLSGVLRFNSFEKVGEVVVEGKEGSSATTDLKGGYKASFKFGEYDPVTDTVRVTDFGLDRVENQEVTNLLTTTLNLKIGQTVAMGASRTPQSSRALMLVIEAQR